MDTGKTQNCKTEENSDYKTFCPACILVGIPLVMGLKALKRHKEKKNRCVSDIVESKEK